MVAKHPDFIPIQQRCSSLHEVGSKNDSCSSGAVGCNRKDTDFRKKNDGTCILHIYIGVIRTISATAGDENLGILNTFFRQKKNWPGRFSPMNRCGSKHQTIGVMLRYMLDASWWVASIPFKAFMGLSPSSSPNSSLWNPVPFMF